MTPNTRQTQAFTSREGGPRKPTPGPVARVSSLKPVRKETIVLSEPDIAVKAYEIWLAQGQETGRDQQHWYEAEQQLRNP